MDMAEPPAPGSEARKLGERYALRGPLGRGGMATVYLADDLKEGGEVAVKMMHAHLCTDRVAVQRFANELRAARRIEHPNVVGALDDGIHDGVPFLVMELVKGDTLEDYVSRRGALSEAAALNVLRQAARGLAGMHAAGVVHRDIKPSNLLLVGDGDPPASVKVADFGLARIGDRSITLDGAVMGTSRYMAPEQLLGEEPDPRTDIYALGMVLFYALCATLPFLGSSSQITLARQILVAAPPPSSLEPSLNPGTDRIVATALRKDPERRYPTMVDMLKDIERGLGLRQGEPRGVPLAGDDRYTPTRSDTATLLATLEAVLR
jgi:serine/threonine-protein kinase